MPGKEVLVKVYDSNGNYITTWEDWSTPPQFRWQVNGGLGALTFRLPRRWGLSGEPGEPGRNRPYDALDYDEGAYDSYDAGVGLGDLMLDNLIKIYIVDQERPLGLLIYQGRLTEYEHHLAEGYVEGTLITYASETVDRFVPDEITFTDEPRNIIETLIDTYLPHVTLDPSSLELGIDITVVFQRQTIKQMLDIIVSMSGSAWFWRINPNDSLTYSQYGQETDPAYINLTIGKEIAGEVILVKSAVERKRRVIVYGALVPSEDPDFLVRISAEAADPDYDPDVTPLDWVIANDRITDFPTAQRIADSLLAFSNVYFYESEFVVADSNYDPGRGYDIEALWPGYVVAVHHPEQQFYFLYVGDHIIGDGHVIGGDWWAQSLKPTPIAEVEYRFSEAFLRLRSRPTRIASELAQLADRLLIEETT